MKVYSNDAHLLAAAFFGLKGVNIIRSFSCPAGGFGKAQLVFAGVFANDKGQVLPAGQLKVRRENFFQGVKGMDGLAVAHKSAQPVFARGIFGQPGVGGSDDELAAGLEQSRQLREAFCRIAHAINQIGHQHHVELTKAGPQMDGVAAARS